MIVGSASWLCSAAKTGVNINLTPVYKKMCHSSKKTATIYTMVYVRVCRRGVSHDPATGWTIALTGRFLSRPSNMRLLPLQV
ncbi:hypothetical protein E2C01_029556 [Portunus trituberculatus]|uniref:Uncharacterized protein n=1 Tax=Portunus trituberculatus TaxID=210409 RepID=A0A5B7ES59_PORTR|nr:hypothetical protein [Portunus trituberculatus]